MLITLTNAECMQVSTHIHGYKRDTSVLAVISGGPTGTVAARVVIVTQTCSSILTGRATACNYEINV